MQFMQYVSLTISVSSDVSANNKAVKWELTRNWKLNRKKNVCIMFV